MRSACIAFYTNVLVADRIPMGMREFYPADRGTATQALKISEGLFVSSGRALVANALRHFR